MPVLVCWTGRATSGGLIFVHPWVNPRVGEVGGISDCSGDPRLCPPPWVTIKGIHEQAGDPGAPVMALHS